METLIMILVSLAIATGPLYGQAPETPPPCTPGGTTRGADPWTGE